MSWIKKRLGGGCAENCNVGAANRARCFSLKNDLDACERQQTKRNHKGADLETSRGNAAEVVVGTLFPLAESALCPCAIKLERKPE